MSDVTIEQEIGRVAELPAHDLRIEWRRLHRAAPPPSLSRDLLLRAIVYRLQERANGGLSQSARRALQTFALVSYEGEQPAPGSTAALKPGVRLVRTWHGETHTVLALQKGFDYRGKQYGSLSQIASAITGVHWSGPRSLASTAPVSGRSQHRPTHAPMR